MSLNEKIYDAITGETTIRPYTLEEEALAAEFRKKAEAEIKELQKKEAARNSALAKLAALGLTEDEIAAL